MVSHLLVVGQNPGKRKWGPDKGSFGRFSRWMDRAGIRYYSFVNLSSDPNWSGKIEEADTDFVLSCIDSPVRVIGWGGKVSRALRSLGVDHLAVPHPSGLNRKLNDPEYVERVVSQIKEYVNG